MELLEREYIVKMLLGYVLIMLMLVYGLSLMEAVRGSERVGHYYT